MRNQNGKKHKRGSDCTINDEPSNNEPYEIASTSTTANTELTARTTPVISITPRGRGRPRKGHTVSSTCSTT